MHIPDVGPCVVLVIVGACADAAREDIVEGLYKLSFGIFGVEEAGLLVEEVAVVEAATDVEVVIILAAQLLCQLCNAPIVIRRCQRNRHSLTLLE